MGLKLKLWINIKRDQETYYDQTHEGEQAIQIGLMFEQQKIHLDEKMRSDDEIGGLFAFAHVYLAVHHEESSAVTIFSDGGYVYSLKEVIDFERQVQERFQSIFPEGLPQNLEDYAEKAYLVGKANSLRQAICEVLNVVPPEYAKEILAQGVNEDSLRYIKETVGIAEPAESE